MDLIYLVVIPLIVYIVVRKLDTRLHVEGNRPLLIVACVLFVVSIFLPSPLIGGEDTEFLTHLLGGGVFVGLLWLYFQSIMKKRLWYIELLQLFALVSTLGVLNELFELFMHEVGITSEPLTDTSWDLLANTLGILLFYAGYQAIKYGKRLFLQR